MAKVTDPNGVQWTVRRRRPFTMSPGFGTRDDVKRALSDGGGTPAPALLLIVIGAGWGFWFIAHWLGLAWRITIDQRLLPDGHGGGDGARRGVDHRHRR